MIKHVRGEERSSLYNWVNCSCGWRNRTYYKPSSDNAKVKWLEHVVISLMEEAEQQ